MGRERNGQLETPDYYVSRLGRDWVLGPVLLTSHKPPYSSEQKKRTFSKELTLVVVR